MFTVPATPLFTPSALRKKLHTTLFPKSGRNLPILSQKILTPTSNTFWTTSAGRFMKRCNKSRVLSQTYRRRPNKPFLQQVLITMQRTKTRVGNRIEKGSQCLEPQAMEGDIRGRPRQNRQNLQFSAYLGRRDGARCGRVCLELEWAVTTQMTWCLRELTGHSLLSACEMTVIQKTKTGGDAYLFLRAPPPP